MEISALTFVWLISGITIVLINYCLSVPHSEVFITVASTAVEKLSTLVPSTSMKAL